MRGERNVCVWECVFVCVCVCVWERERERSACRKWINNKDIFVLVSPAPSHIHPFLLCVCVCVLKRQLFYSVLLCFPIWQIHLILSLQRVCPIPAVCFVWHNHTHNLLSVEGLAFPGGGEQGAQSQALLQSVCVSGCVCVCVWDVCFPVWKMAHPLPICRETWANRERFLFVLLCSSVPAQHTHTCSRAHTHTHNFLLAQTEFMCMLFLSGTYFLKGASISAQWELATG